jgi:hypothetical protein
MDCSIKDYANIHFGNAARRTHEQILAITAGFWQNRALAVAAELELADVLAAGPQHIDVLAARTKTHSPTLFRLFRALETLGVFSQVSPFVFANTPAGEGLRRNVPNTQWPLCWQVDQAGMASHFESGRAIAGMANRQANESTTQRGVIPTGSGVPAHWRDLLVHRQHIHRIRPAVRTYSTFSPVAMIAFPSETSRTALPCLFTTKYTTRGGVPLEGIVIVAVPVQSPFTV